MEIKMNNKHLTSVESPVSEETIQDVYFKIGLKDFQKIFPYPFLTNFVRNNEGLRINVQIYVNDQKDGAKESFSLEKNVILNLSILE